MRIAVYFSPAPDDAWWRFGARWLGRDPRGVPAPAPWPALGWDTARRARLAARPRRYGFHATLVAPFRLAPGRTAADVSQAAAALAATLAPASAVELAPAELDGFVALRPVRPAPAVDVLAAAALRAFAAHRAAPTAADRARYGVDRMPPRARALFERWGHPDVEDRFRFHFTLTDPLAPDERRAVLATARRVLAHETAHVIDVDAIALFVQDHDDADFRFVGRHLLGMQPGKAGADVGTRSA